MRRWVAALVLVGILAVAGCAPEPDHSWSPPVWPVTAITLTSAPGFVDPAAIAGQNRQRIRNDAVGIAARYTYLPGVGGTVEAFNDAVDGVVRAAITAQSTTTGVAYRPIAGAPGAGLADRGCVTGSTAVPAEDLLADPLVGPTGGAGTAVVCDIVAAGATMFGERLRVVTGDAVSVTADTTTTLFVDTATGGVSTADQLWTSDAAAVLAADVVDVLRREVGALTEAAPAPLAESELAGIRGALALTVPVADGFDVTVPAGFQSPELARLGASATAAPMTVHVPSAVAAPILTDLGRQVLAAIPQPYAGPSPVNAGFDRVDCTLVPCVALTYDDGPGDFTAAILDALAAHHAAATFFVMGEKTARYAALIRREVGEGHIVGNHTWNHPHLPKLKPAEVVDQITRASAAIQAVLGAKPQVFRPPCGDYTSAVLAEAALPAILWDVDTFDWAGRGDDQVVAAAVQQPTAGSIVLQHDIQASTARTVAAVYEGLADRGFTLVNLAQLFGGAQPTSGVWRHQPE